LQPESRAINELVRELELLMSRIIDESLKVDVTLGSGAGACHVDPAQFGSALLNLVINARDAMPAGGQISVRTGTVVLDQRGAAQHADAQPGEYVMVEVSDTGAGMAPEVLERATEPFYTTKGPGQGTGLGLSQVYGFIKQSGGHTRIYSEPGQGTTVKMYLPRAQTGVAVAKDHGAVRETSVERASGQTILVVEDEDKVRMASVEMLEELGYRVLEAALGVDGDRCPTDVTVDYGRARLGIEIQGQGSVEGLDRQLHGISERIALYEGPLTINPLGAGGFAISAQLPRR
jgi:hypothetical protein